jgi:hypothetical protein
LEIWTVNRHETTSELTPQQVDKKRDAAVRRALSTPPKPKQQSVKPKEPKEKRSK